jgi:MFS family permease
VWRSAGLLAALSGAFALWWFMGGFRFTLVPLFAEERLGLDVAAISFGITVSAIANLCTTWPAGWAADHYGRHAVGVPAFVGIALAAGAMLLARDFPTYLAANALLGACYGAAAIVPGTLLADAVPRERAGEAARLVGRHRDLASHGSPKCSATVGRPAVRPREHWE